MKKIIMKGNIINKIPGIFLCAIFILTALLFFFVQYVYSGPSYYMYPNFSGLDLTFGLAIEGGRTGFFPFILTVVFSIIGVICAAISIFKESKYVRKILFCVCIVIALISSLIYLMTYFYEMSRYGDNKGFVKWTFAFWGAFALYCMALLVSLLIVIYDHKNKSKNN